MVDNSEVEQRLIGLDLNDTSQRKERVSGVRIELHPNADIVLRAMADDGWRVVQMAAGFGNWLYVLFERESNR